MCRRRGWRLWVAEGSGLETPRVLLESRKFRVVRREVRGRDGAVHMYDVIEHGGAVVVLPLLDDGRVVMIQNHRPAVDGELLELPAGTIEAGEPPEHCARRELEEETGWRAARLAPLCTFYTTPGMTSERMHAFVATGLTPGTAALDETERIEPLVMLLEKAIAAIGDGRIMDAKTIVALLHYDRFMRAAGVGGIPAAGAQPESG